VRIETLKRDAKAAYLLRLEEAARTENEFMELVKMHNALDRNRERVIRRHETHCDDDGTPLEEMDVFGRGVVPPPLNHPYWRELINGDFISDIFDNPAEMWQIMEDEQIAEPLHYALTEKQAQALFLSAVRLARTENIACYTDKSDRAVRRLIADAKKHIRQMLARDVMADIKAKRPTTLEKRRLIEEYAELAEESEEK
jgi:DNA-directed RNA polymerase specialized sigma24 family protein